MVKREVVSKKAVEEYYANYFKPIDLAKVIGLDDFDRREFAWVEYPIDDNVSKKKLFVRNIRFGTARELLRNIPIIAPYKFYFGAVYQNRWCDPYDATASNIKRGSIRGIPWDHNELHFDMDVNDSDLMRRGGICKCGNSKDKEKRKKICPECFQIVKEAAIFLEDTLDEDFGISKKDSMDFFSGARGLHKHYPKVTRIGLNENDEKRVRRNMVDYLSIVKEDEEVVESTIVDGVEVKKKNLVAIIGKVNGALTLKKRIEQLVYKWFFTRSPERTVKKTRISSIALRVINEAFERGGDMTDAMGELSRRDLLTDRQRKRIRETVFTYRYPRYDGGATYDVRKVIKVPGSIDCSTGYIITRIDDIDGFDLGDVDHVFNYVKN